MKGSAVKETATIRLNGSASWLHAGTPGLLRMSIPLAAEGSSGPPAAEGAAGAGSGVPSPAATPAAAVPLSPEAEDLSSRLFGGGGNKPADKPAEGAAEKDKPAEGDTPPAGEQKAEDKPAEGEGEKKEGEEGKDGPAPFSADAIKLPDGVAIDQGALEAASPVIAELGLNQEQGQKLVDAYVKIREKEAANYAETVAAWETAAKADKEIGGTRWDASLHAARSVLDKFGTPELREYLEMTGAGNHPEVIRAFARIGAKIGEDDPVVSRPPASTKPGDDVIELLYGKG